MRAGRNSGMRTNRGSSSEGGRDEGGGTVE